MHKESERERERVLVSKSGSVGGLMGRDYHDHIDNVQRTPLHIADVVAGRLGERAAPDAYEL